MSCDTLKIILVNILKKKENNNYAPSPPRVPAKYYLLFHGLFSDAEPNLVPSMQREVLLLYTDLIR